MKRILRPALSALAIAVLWIFAGPAEAADVQITPDVVYGHKDGLALTFDVLQPKTNANGAAVLFMVSGGWVSTWNPPEETATRFSPLLDRGFTLIAVRHGSSPKYLIPEIVSDVRRAVRFVRYNAKQWNVDPDRIGVQGGSAGGHLALMLATTSDSGNPSASEPFLRESDRVASVVAYFPPTDLRAWTRGLAPAGPDAQVFPALNFEREKAPDYSPILHVTKDGPPTLLIHGDRDQLVPISHSQDLYKVLLQAGVKAEFITIPGAGHGFTGKDAERAATATIAWFEQTLLPAKR